MAYDNSNQRERARSTRARVLDAARGMFLTQGFAGTTIRSVAHEAGVSQETVYKTFGSKAALLKAVYDVSLVGDDRDLALAARPEALAVREADTPAAAAAAYAGLAQVIAERVDPLLRVLLGSRDTDQALAAFAETTDQERHAGSTFFVRHWAGRGWLRDDLTIPLAADAVWALNAPQARWLLLDRGWSHEQYTRWLADLIHHAIFTRPRT